MIPTNRWNMIWIVVIVLLIAKWVWKRKETFVIRNSVPSDTGMVEQRTSSHATPVISGSPDYPNGREYDPNRDVNLVGTEVPPPYRELTIPSGIASCPYRGNLPGCQCKGSCPLRTARDEYRGVNGPVNPDTWIPMGPATGGYIPVNRPYPPMTNQSTFVQSGGAYVEERYNPTVVGCGGRNGPCEGGSEDVIYNWMPPRVVSNENIAPMNVDASGQTGPEQVGVIYKINGVENEWLPLYGERMDARRWMYYTLAGPDRNMRMVVDTERPGEEVGMNDEVRVKGLMGYYRVSRFDRNVPQFVE